MRIALIGTTAACVLNFRGDLIRSLSSQGHIVYAFAIDYDEKTRFDVGALGAIPVDYHISRSGVSPFKDLISTFSLAKQLRSLKLDVVFSYFAKPVVFGTIAAKLAGISRIIGMLEGLGYPFTVGPNGLSKKAQLLKSFQLALYSVTFPALESLIVLNSDDRDELKSFRFLRIQRFYVLGGIGVDLDFFKKKSPPPELAFIFVGRLLAEKGIFEFVDAAKEIKASHPDVNFYVLGGKDDSNPGSLSSDQIDSLVEAGVINYIGEVSDVKPWLEKSSVFVLPSYREGVPKSTQEALAIGRAVITTNVPGCRETVVDGVNGFLIPPWSCSALSNRMKCFLDNPDLAVKMGAESRLLAEEKYCVIKANEKLVSCLLYGAMV